MEGVVKLTEGLSPAAGRVAELDCVSLKRENSLSLSFITWSNRTLVESRELGLDQVAVYAARLSCFWPVGGHWGSVVGSQATKTSGPLGTGKAWTTGWSALGAGFLPDTQALIPRMHRSGTKL